MRAKILYISIAAATLFLSACEDFLELEPLDRVPASRLFSDITGVKTVLATIYNSMPMEDFRWVPDVGFNYPTYIEGGWALASHTDEAVIESNAGGRIGPIGDGYWDYTGIRYVNMFFATIKTVPMDPATYKRLESEAHFIRAYQYFALAKRYGGVPIITEVQDIGEGGDNSALYVARSTEKETWDFVLSECDSAIKNLPTTTTSQDGQYRATKWAAYALKARAALFAASVGKYWNNAALTGDAVDQKLVGGMTLTDANNYYLQCINACKAIIDNSGKQLYKPNPTSIEEAVKNYQAMFETPSIADIEVIFKKSYINGIPTGGQQGHFTDAYFYPTQTKLGNQFEFARYWPTLEQVESYEDYSDDGTGASGVLVTRTDGVETEYSTEPGKMNFSIPYKLYDNTTDIFDNKDARLYASVILPGAIFKGVKIIMQGGLITPDGTSMIFNAGSATGLDGETYYAYGSNDVFGYSGFDQMGSRTPNHSTTGFSLRKFLNEAKTPEITPDSKNICSSTQDWIDFRLAEIYLNYAEAAIESGQGDAALAKTYLNSIRQRAMHTDEIPATIANIMKERRVELAFEGHRYWDLVRRREMHTLFTAAKRKSLVPILDLRQNPPKYIFIRAYNYYDQTAGGMTFTTRSYYISIPGVATNLLVQNPGY